MAESLPHASADAEDVRASQSDFADLWARARRVQAILGWVLLLAGSLGAWGFLAAAVRRDWFAVAMFALCGAVSIVGWIATHWTVTAWHAAAIARVQAARAGRLVDQWRDAYLKLKQEQENQPSQ